MISISVEVMLSAFANAVAIDIGLGKRACGSRDRPRSKTIVTDGGIVGWMSAGAVGGS